MLTTYYFFLYFNALINPIFIFMMNNYNSLNYRKFSKFRSQEPEVVGNSPNSRGSMRTSWLVSLMIMFAYMFIGNSVFAQTTIINPTSAGAFEGASFAADGWTVLNNTTEGASWVSSTGATAGFTGTKCAYITANTAAVPPPHTYSNSPTNRVSALYRDVTVPAGETTITLSFKWICVGESGYDRLQVWAVPTTYTPLNGTTGMTTTGSAPTGRVQLGAGATGYQSSSSWTTANITVPAAYAGNSFRLVFQWRNDTSGGSNPPIAIDDVSLVSSCSGAVATAATNITNTSASANWNAFTGATSYDLKYRVVGNSTWTTLSALSGTTTSITGLTANTNYEYQIRANGAVCNTWSSSITFTTLCNPVSTLPWTENFDSMSSIGSGIVPSCWKNVTGTSAWSSYNTSSTTYNAPRSTPNYMVIPYSNTTASGLWSPGFTLTSGTSYDFSFYYNTNGTSSSYIGYTGTALVNSSQSATSATTLGTFITATQGTTSYTKYTVSFTPSSTGTYYFGINVSSTSDPWYLGIDDVSVSLTPTCVSPTALTSSSVTNNTATIGWTASTTPPTNGYDYYVSTSSAAPTGSTTPTGNVGTTTYSAVLTGLTANTTYYYWVRSNCSVSDQSTWAGYGTFTTLCDPVSSISENFDSLTTPALPSCWSKILRGSTLSSFATVGSYNSTTYALSAPNSIQMYNSSSATSGSDDIILVSPYLSNLNAGTYRLRFYANYAGSLQIGTLNNNTSTATFTSLQTITTTGTNTEYIVNFNTYSGSDKFIGFRMNTSSTYTYIYIDNVVWEPIPTCFVPTAVTVSALTTNGATIAWTAPTQGSPSTYQYEIRTSGAAGSGATGLAASGTITAPTVTTGALTSLNSATTYSVYVRTFCGGSDYSSWTNVVTFTTLCNPVSTFPWTENFDAMSTLGTGVLPNCWSHTAGSYSFTSANAASNTYNDPRSTPNYVTIYYPTTAAYLWTPTMQLVAGKSYDFSFYWAGDATSGWVGDAFVNTSANPTGATSLGASFVVSGTTTAATYTKATYTFVPTTTGTYNFGIKAYSATFAPYYMGFDDFKVDYTPTAISNFSPATVCSQSGSTVTINGASFTGATSVKFNGVNATSYTVVSDSQITAVAPVGVTAGYITVNGVNNTATSATMLAVTNNPTLPPITITSGATPTCLNLDDTSDNVQLSNTYPSGTWSSSDISIATVDGSGLVTPLGEGTVTITYTASSGTNPTCSSSVTKDITIYKPVVISASTSVQTVVTGNNATFSVTATGTGMTYQWQESAYDAGTDTYGPFVAITDAGIYSGATTNSLTITGTPDTLNGYQYMCTITGTSPCGSVDSNPATLNVGDTGITGDPADVSLCENGSGTANFTVTPSGTVDSYVWYENQGLGFNPITNGTVAGVTYDVTVPGTLTLTGLTLANTGWTYKVDVVGPANTASSNAALLTINQAPSFSVDPSNQTVCYTGGSASFGATLTGNYTGVQWQYSTDNSTWNNVVNGTPVGATYTGATYTGATYTGSLGVTTTASTPASGTYYYKAVALAAAPCSGTSSASAQLIINNPTITTAPSATTIVAGNSGSFSVVSTASSPTYQWQYATALAGSYSDVVDLTPGTVTYTGATSATLSVVTTSNTPASTSNYYRCIVTSNGSCSVTSTGAQLTIATYCQPSTTTGGSTDTVTNAVITNVTQGTNITQATSAAAPWYTFYNNTPLNVTQGQNMSVAMTFGTDGTQYSAVWVDYNRDGVFSASENVALASAAAGGGATVTYNFTIPYTATPGITRIRLRGASDSAYTAAGACTSSSYGETQDYLLNIIVAPACSGTPTAGAITSSVTNVCFTGTATLTANGYSTGVTGISLQWYNSAGAISGATNSTYTTPTLSASETYFCRVTCANGGAYADTNSITIGVDAPAVDTTTPNTRCGTGTVVLGATGSAGSTLNWYAAATGGTSLGTGTSFTTPSISTTTTYYVDASIGGGSGNAGYVGNAASTNGTNVGSHGIAITTTLPNIKINSVKIPFTGTGTITIALKDTSNSTVISSVVSSTVTGNGLTPVTVPLNMNISTAGSYLLIVNAVSGTVGALGYTSSLSGVYPSSALNGAFSVTGGYWYSVDTTTNMYIYDLSVSNGCTGSRTAVTATVTAPPALTLNGASTAICNGNTSNAVSITSTISDYDTYTWSPNTGVSGSAATGFTFNPTATTVYTLTASNTSGCVNTATYTVTVNPLPTAAAITPSSPSICLNSVQSLTVNTGGTATFGTGTTATAATSYPNPLSAYYGGVKHQMLYTVAELTAQGLQAGSQINAVTFYINNFAANACTDFTIRIGTTSNTALSGFVTGTSTVYGPTTFTPSATGLVSFTLTTPYVWDGSSNLVIETVHNAGNGGNGSGTRTRVSTTTNNSVYYGAKDNVAGGITGFDALTSYSSSGASTSRPNMTFVFTNIAPTWSPTTDLYTNAGATTAYTGSSLGVVYAKPSTTTTYTATYTSSFGCTSTSTVTVTVSPTSVAGTATATDSTICSGSSTSLTLNGYTGSIQWQSSANGSTGWTNVSGATSASLTTANLTATTYYKAVVTSGVCSSATSNVVTVTVSPTSVAGTASAAASTLCSGTSTTLTLSGSTGSIQWQEASSATGPWTDVSGATSVTLNTGNLTATTYYQAVVTSGVCSSVTSNSVTVTVVPVSVAGTASALSTQFCAGLGTSLSLTGNTGSIQWQQASSATGPWTNVSGATSASLSTGNLTATTYYQAVVTNSVCSSATSNVVTVTVNPIPTVTVSLGNAVLCPNTTTTVTAVPGLAGTYNYVWTVPAGVTNPGNVDSFTTGVAGVYRVVITNPSTGCVSTQASSSLSISTQCATLTSCGITLAALDTPIYSTLVANAQGYRWRVTKMINGVASTNPADIQSIDTQLRTFKIVQLTSYAFDTQYQVEVAVRVNNVWPTYYSAACTFRTPATTTQIISTQCGGTLAMMTDVVYADIVSYTSGYRFKVTNLLNTNDVQIIDRSLREFRFNLLNNIPFNNPYKIEVAIRNTDGTYLPYGPACTVTTPSFPTTALQNSQCDYVATSTTELIYANLVSNATLYRFYFTNTALGYSYTVDKPLRVFQLNTIPGLSGGTTYTVQVAVQIGGVFGPYGKACTITTPVALNAKSEAVATAAVSPTATFEVMALPNPFAENFKLDVQTSSDALIHVKVYDMLGKLLESREVTATDVQTLEVGSNYPSGVYNVIVTQGDNAKTLRVIKR